MSSALSSTRTTAAVAPATTWRELAANFFVLGKPRITLLVMITSVAAAWVGARGPVSLELLFHLALGTGILAAGTAALNQRWEHRTDALMHRTAGRPLPAGRLTLQQAALFGLILLAGGLVYLAFAVNPLCALLGGFTAGSYLLLYTPLKTVSPISTWVGAFPGAAPILMGWAATRGSLGLGGWSLFAIQFLWQFPHFLAIAWLYRDEYAAAGIRMLPVVDREGGETGAQILYYALALLPMSLLPALLHLDGTVYFLGALILGLWLLHASWQAARRLSSETCKRLLHVSIIYLPLLFALMTLDHLR